MFVLNATETQSHLGMNMLLINIMMWKLLVFLVRPDSGKWWEQKNNEWVPVGVEGEEITAELIILLRCMVVKRKAVGVRWECRMTG